MISRLIQEVWLANTNLARHGLVLYAWGNVSAIDRDEGIMVIKPSGADLDELFPEQMSVVNMSGELIQGSRPSLDTWIHLEIYKAFPGIRSVAHTHSTYATAWAQAEHDLPVMGSTHAGYFYGDIPCTRRMRPDEISTDYEQHTGMVIAETFRERGLEPVTMPAVLVASHGAFSWGNSAEEAVETCVILETIAKMAVNTLRVSLKTINEDNERLEKELIERHYWRKHGK